MTEGEAHEDTPQPAKAVDNTGAGDACAVGLVAAHLAGHPVDMQIDWGRRNASGVVQKVGAKNGLLSHEELESATLNK